ncbi:MAG: hypothetical protein KGR42_03380 [Acidobacteria bacterium]|nr:hypothetical protein [Acidobacteriota bacterium]
MAGARGSRQRRGPRRESAPVPIVLDPTWQSPYSPNAEERDYHAKALKRYLWQWRRSRLVLAGVVVVALLAASFVHWWFSLFALVVIAVAAIDTQVSLSRALNSEGAMATRLLDHFTPSGDPTARVRVTTLVERLGATFGVDGVSSFVVSDPVYNAALVPNGTGLSLFVTDALVRDFELIEFEGVLAHLFARTRVGVLERQVAAALLDLTEERRRTLAGSGLLYRCDEVGAAQIRYPLGLSGALRRCAAQDATSAYFSSEQYRSERSVWFDAHSDRAEAELSDLDDATLRAMALEEW